MFRHVKPGITFIAGLTDLDNLLLVSGYPFPVNTSYTHLTEKPSYASRCVLSKLLALLLDNLVYFKYMYQ